MSKTLRSQYMNVNLTGHGSTGKFEMGTKHRMRNEVPQIGLGFKFNFILNYIFPFLVPLSSF